MATIEEGRYLSDLVKWEVDNYQSRETVTALAGQRLAMGDVIGRISRSVPTSGVAGASNVGNGICTGVVGGPKTKIGSYVLTCSATGTNGGTFMVVDPDGYMLPNATVGAAYNHQQISFQINDGSTDFAVGDIFTITIAEGAGKVKTIDFDAKDGAADAFGIMVVGCDAADGDKKGVAIVRDAQIAAEYLGWPESATNGQKAAALKQLYTKGIVTREIG